MEWILYADQCPKEAAIGLAAIGPEGWEVLKKATASKGNTVPCVVWALGSHHIKASGAEDALVASYFRNNPVTTDVLALWALTESQPDNEKLIPALMEGLHSDREDLKWGSAVLLGRLGRKAQVAVPELEKLLGHANHLVRHDAAQALEQIDPVEAQRVGVAGALASEHVPKTIL